MDGVRPCPDPMSRRDPAATLAFTVAKSGGGYKAFCRNAVTFLFNVIKVQERFSVLRKIFCANAR
jgi:hypothetical protein